MSMIYKIQPPMVQVKQYVYATGKDVMVSIPPPQAQIDEYKQWCKDRIGTNGWNYYGIYRKIPCQFRFKREEDLLAFRLRFGL